MNAQIEKYVPLITLLGESLPNICEVFLFDLTEKGMPVAAQHNARRKTADALRSYLKTILKSKTVVKNGLLTNRNSGGPGEMLCKTSVLLIKDETGDPVGALVLSIAVMELLPMHNCLQELLTFDTTDIEDIQPRQECVQKENPTLDTIDWMVAEFADQPERLTPDEKMELIIDLYDTGVFELKGAVARAAFVLGMSEQSVYRYLAKIRRIRGD